PDLVLDVVEEGGNLESFLTKPRIVGQRQAKVPRADDGDAQFAIETENLPQMAAKIADVVADAANAKLTEIGEVLANLRRVQMKAFREALRRNGFDASAL